MTDRFETDKQTVILEMKVDDRQVNLEDTQKTSTYPSANLYVRKGSLKFNKRNTKKQELEIQCLETPVLSSGQLD